MALNFPSSPTNGQTYTDLSSGNSYVYDSANTIWVYNSTSGGSGGGASITGTSNTQVLFNSLNTISGSNGFTFSSDTLYANNISLTNDITKVNSIFLNTTALAAANGSVVAGQMTWNPDDKTLDVGTGESILQVGQEQYIRVRNGTGVTIFNSNAVAYLGTIGNSGKMTARPAIANNSYDSKYILGLATEDIAPGADGFVTVFGKIRKIDTSMFSEGDVLYVSSSIVGALQNTKPTAPNNRVEIGTVITSSATVGEIFVSVERGSSLADDELANFTSLTNGDVIRYVSANGRFENISDNRIGPAINANAAFIKANSALANTSGVSFVGDLYFPNGNVTIGGTTTNFKLQVYGSFAANTKSFVIDHPTKEGMKLRYGSLEGPENGVYVRGRTGGNVIELPDYWIGLVDESTITVSLTPYGRPQNLFVSSVNSNSIYVDNEDGSSPAFYYHVYAERKDVEKLIVEFDT